MADFEGLTEQLRREIRESMDVFMTDARDLATKYGGPSAPAQNPEVVATLACALANQFAAAMLADALKAATEGNR
ncbi:MAG: hypothetical protein ACK4WC_15005 [Rubrimonas sp.]